MDWRYSDSDDRFRDEVRRFLRDELPEAIRHKVENGIDLKRDDMIGWHKILHRRGWVGPNWPKKYGGPGWSMTERYIFDEECGLAGAPRIISFGINMCGPVIMAFGTDKQKDYFLPRILSAEHVWCQGYSAPGAGSDLASLQTQAVRDGDHWVINGSKMWITNGTRADYITLLVKTDPDAGHGGMSMIVFPTDVEGFSVSRKLEKLGNRSSDTAELAFDGCRVPVENLIGQEGKGFRYILDGMNAERVLVGSEALGDGRWFTDKAVEYANERVVFGRPIGRNQGVQFPIAKAYAQMRAAELVLGEAIRLYEAGGNPGEEANMAKMLAADASWAAAEACVQTHGGFGFAEEYDIERKFREARLYQVAPISTNLILSYIAEHVLGMPRSY